MCVQERFDVADIGGRPVGLAAARGQELREVTHRGEASLERGVPARAGAGAAGAIAAGDKVFGEPGHRRSQGGGHGVDAGLAAGGGAAFVAVGRQCQLARGEEVFQGPRERHVVGDSSQQCLRMRRVLVAQVLAESGEHGARAAGVMAADQVGGEGAQPVWRISQCLGEIGGADGDPVRRAFPTGSTPPGTGQSGDPAAVDAGRVRIRWPARMRTRTAQAGGRSQYPAFAAARAVGSIGVSPLPSETFLAQVSVDEQHRGLALSAGARAAHAAAGVRLQDPVDAAARAGVGDRGVGGRPVAACTQVTVGFADRAAAAAAVPDPAGHA